MRAKIAEISKSAPKISQTFWRIFSGAEGSCIRFKTCNEGPIKVSAFDAWQSTGQPLLAGQSWDMLSITGAKCQRYDCLQCIDNGDFLIGIAQLPVTAANLEEQSRRIYRAIFKTTSSRFLYRIWNFVPRINREEQGMIENYKLFCSGRAQAFSDYYDHAESSHFPSASATGCDSDDLTVVFLAGAVGATHWENPEQIPAYKYPEKYGPRSPAFARGSRFIDTKGGEWILVAGTAAIKGSETLYPGDFSRQLPVVIENMEIVLKQVGVNLAAEKNRRSHFKFFLRHAKNLNALQTVIRGILGPMDTYSIVRADICRADLEVEVELTIYPLS